MFRRLATALLGVVAALVVAATPPGERSVVRAQDVAARDAADAALHIARTEDVCHAEARVLERAREASARWSDPSVAAYEAVAAARLVACTADLARARSDAALAGCGVPGPSLPPLAVGAARVTAGAGIYEPSVLSLAVGAHRTEAARCATPKVLGLPRDVSGEVTLRLTVGTGGAVTDAAVLAHDTGSDALAGCALAALSQLRFSPGPPAPVTFTVELRYGEPR